MTGSLFRATLLFKLSALPREPDSLDAEYRHPRAIVDRIGETGEFEQALSPARQFPQRGGASGRRWRRMRPSRWRRPPREPERPAIAGTCENAVADDAPAR